MPKIKDIYNYIILIFVVMVIGFLIYAQAYKESKDNINNIEERLTKQEHYMHSVQADLDNMKEVISNVK